MKELLLLTTPANTLAMECVVFSLADTKFTVRAGRENAQADPIRLGDLGRPELHRGYVLRQTPELPQRYIARF